MSFVRWRRLAALVLLVGIVLLPLRAVAATVTMLIAYDAAVSRTSTTTQASHHAVRSEGEDPHINACDCDPAAPLAYDAPSSLRMTAGAGGAHTYDDALEHADRREGAIYDASAATTAAEGGGQAMTTLFRTVSEGERAAIEATGAYEPALGGVEGKYFYPTVEQAEALARANVSSQGVQTLTSVQVPTSMLQQATQLSVASEGRVIFMTSEQLSGVGTPTVWNFFPVGGGAP